MYGYMTWLNYLQASRYTHQQTPALANTHEQPVSALKDSVTNFMAYITAAAEDDRIGLSIYTYTDSTAVLESPLTATYSSLSTIVAAAGGPLHRRHEHLQRHANGAAAIAEQRPHERL